MEYRWTDRTSTSESKHGSATDIEVYAAFEYRCFIDRSWNVTRQLTCLSVSKSAYAILVKAASNANYQPKELQAKLRPCLSTAIYEAIDCLRSDSSLQVLQSAITGTMLSIQPEFSSQHKDDRTLFTQVLAFHTCDKSHISYAVRKYGEVAKKQPLSELPQCALPKRRRTEGGYALRNEWLSEYRRRTADRSFKKESSRIVFDEAEKIHDPLSCNRCSRYQETKSPDRRQWAAPWKPIEEYSSTDNTILVEGKRNHIVGGDSQTPSEFCLFKMGNAKGITSIASTVKTHLKSNKIYQAKLQTLQSPHDNNVAEGAKQNEVNLYNQPLLVRAFTDKEYLDLKDWIVDLQDKENDNRIREACKKGLYNFSRQSDSQDEGMDDRKRKR